MQVEYSYTPDQVRVFAPNQEAIQDLDEYKTRLEIWLNRKKRTMDRSEKS